MQDNSQDWQQRSRALLADGSLERLAAARVAVVGLGGVGAAAAEALVRVGVGTLFIMDYDTVASSNRNRQLIALSSTQGQLKAQVAAARYRDINPQIELTVCAEKLDADTVGKLLAFAPHYVVDAIDMVSAKLLLIESCRAAEIPIVSCMGTGNRLDPQRFKVGTAAQTAGCGCPLARVMRRELKRRGLEDTEVLFSTEPPVACAQRDIIGSVSFVPPSAGYALAAHVVAALLK